MSRIDKPNYYQLPNGLEALDVCRHLNFNLGNAVKYIIRAGRKTEEGMSSEAKAEEDLKKAIYYLEDELKKYR